MSNYAVIDILYGDGGKGLVTDFLCARDMARPLVVRFSGGQQAGHTVVRDMVKHVFSNFGSGTLAGAPTYWSKQCTVDPVAVMRELKALLGYGIDPILYINEHCPVTTPFDKAHNRRVANNGHGTCGVGVGATIDREEKLYHLLAGDMRYEFVFRKKLEMLRRNLYGIKNMTVEWQDEQDEFLSACMEMLRSPHISFVSKIPIWINESNMVFEGSQGLMLDPDIGFFPHVTRTHTGTLGVLGMCNDFTVYAVTRAYQTRHGNGPLSNEDKKYLIPHDRRETNVPNRWQGEFRRSMLDLDTMKYALGKDEYIRQTDRKVLVITCLDHVKDNWAFTWGGEVVRFDNEADFVNKIACILDFSAAYVSHGPTAADISGFPVDRMRAVDL